MYFPEEILDVKNILRNLDDEISNYEKIAIIDSCIERLKHFRPRFLYEPHEWTHIKNEILGELRYAREKCERSMISARELEHILFEKYFALISSIK